ncbi:hypothetical protein AOLI_G00247750 [Acnodon oligacanthus]
MVTALQKRLDHFSAQVRVRAPPECIRPQKSSGDFCPSGLARRHTVCAERRSDLLSCKRGQRTERKEPSKKPHDVSKTHLLMGHTGSGACPSTHWGEDRKHPGQVMKRTTSKKMMMKRRRTKIGMNKVED